MIPILKEKIKAAITKPEALKRKMVPLTTAYSEYEYTMLDTVAKDLERDKMDWAIVKTRSGMAVWRLSANMKWMT